MGLINIQIDSISAEDKAAMANIISGSVALIKTDIENS